MTTIKFKLAIVFLCSFYLMGNSQDAHFTQYHQVPGQFNPALTGTFGGLYRVGINYRDQWSPAINTPFQTFSASGDVKFELGAGRSGKDIAALGIMFISDRTDLFDLNTTGIALTGAFHKALDKKTKQYIGGGAQVGIYQRNLNYENLKFQDQFNAIDSYSLESNENLPVNNFGTFDFNLGINYSISPRKRTNLNIGASLFHVVPGNRSFFDKNDIDDESIDTDFNIYRRINFHASYAFPTSETLVINPRILYVNQGPHNQILLSNLFKIKGLQDDTKQFFIGPALRMANDVKGFNLESVILQTGIEYNGLIFGLSYDYNVDDLLSNRAGLGAFEFSINFLGEYENEDTFCPTF